MTSRDLPLLLAVAPGFLVAWLATFLVRRWAPRWGLIDRPGHRKVHTTPTPMGGGLAIWLGVMTTFALVQIVVVLAPTHVEILPEFARPHVEGVRDKLSSLWMLLGAATTMMVLGLVDDFRGLHWTFRLGVQAAVAAFCVWRWEELRLSMFMDAPVLTGALSVLWIMALVNSFNMLDNMDGLSGGVAAISSAMLAAVLLAMPDPETG